MPDYLEQTAPIAKSQARKALLLASLALFASFFFGWGLPLAVSAIGAAIVALRSPNESVRMARWALGLSILATAFSIGWFVWLWMQLTQPG